MLFTKQYLLFMIPFLYNMLNNVWLQQIYKRNCCSQWLRKVHKFDLALIHDTCNPQYISPSKRPKCSLLRDKHHNIFSPQELNHAFGYKFWADAIRRVAENKISLPKIDQSIVVRFVIPVRLICARIPKLFSRYFDTIEDRLEYPLRSFSLVTHNCWLFICFTGTFWFLVYMIYKELNQIRSPPHIHEPCNLHCLSIIEPWERELHLWDQILQGVWN